MIIEGYSQFGATERVAGALRNILDHYGVVAPHSGEPFTEALIMGIGGGLGAEYHTTAHTGKDPSRQPYNQLSLRFHHFRNYIEKKELSFLAKATERIGGELTIKETASRKAAHQFLTESLEAGKPMMVKLSVWQGIYYHNGDIKEAYQKDPDFFPPLLYDEFLNFLPYYSLPYPWIVGHLATVFGIDEDVEKVHISDFSNQPLTLSTHQLAESRGIVKAWKNRAYTLNPPKTKPNLTKTIRLGIQDCVKSLLHEKTVAAGAHYRTEAWYTMAAKIGDFEGKRGWLFLFPEPWQLFDTLTRIHAQIAFHNSDGGALRSSYADFLEEASDILEKPELKQIAHQFSDIGIMWDEIGTAALHDDIPELLQARKAALEWNNTFKVHGSAKSNTLETLSKTLQNIRTKFSVEFPITERELTTLLEELSSRIHEVYEAETTALQALRREMK
jgi:hypothetical protein